MCASPGAVWYSVTTVIPKPKVSLMASLSLEQRRRFARQANKADDRRAQQEQQKEQAAKWLAFKQAKLKKGLDEADKPKPPTSEGVVLSFWHWLDDKCAF
jgi:hypothetical protein